MRPQFIPCSLNKFSDKKLSVSWVRQLCSYSIMTSRSSCTIIYVVISINRYYAIVNPIKYSIMFTKTTVYRISFGITFAAILIWLPLNIGFYFYFFATFNASTMAVSLTILSDECSFAFSTELYRFEPTNKICSKCFWRGILFLGFASIIITFVINMIALARLKKSSKVRRNFQRTAIEYKLITV